MDNFHKIPDNVVDIQNFHIELLSSPKGEQLFNHIGCSENFVFDGRKIYRHISGAMLRHFCQLGVAYNNIQNIVKIMGNIAYHPSHCIKFLKLKKLLLKLLDVREITHNALINNNIYHIVIKWD